MATDEENEPRVLSGLEFVTMLDAHAHDWLMCYARGRNRWHTVYDPLLCVLDGVSSWGGYKRVFGVYMQRRALAVPGTPVLCATLSEYIKETMEDWDTRGVVFYNRADTHGTVALGYVDEESKHHMEKGRYAHALWLDRLPQRTV